jgi:hypothetical protein
MQDPQLTERPQENSAATKARGGFVVATVVLVTLGCKIGILDNDRLQARGAYICAGLGLVGVILWGLGRWNEARRTRLAQAQAAQLEPPADQHPLALLWSGKHWGFVLMLSAAIMAGIVCYRRPQLVLSAAARMIPTNIISASNVAIASAPNMVATTIQKPAVTFPPLVLSGVVVNGDRSSAVINGQVLRVGETIGNVELVGVDRRHAFVALQGETNALSLRN